MRKIGMIVAVEIGAVQRRYGEPKAAYKHGDMNVTVYDVPGAELTVCHTGFGEIAAAAGTQLLISLYGAEMILNYGVVGGLTEEMALAKSCAVEKAVHYDLDVSAIDPVLPAQYPGHSDIYLRTDESLLAAALLTEPDLRKVTCASADRFVDGAEEKKALHEKYGADICDMESAAVILTAERNRVPCLLLKTVSDACTGGAEDYRREVERTSDLCLEVMDRVLGGLS